MLYATTLLRFRHLLEKHALTQRIFEEINASLAEQSLFMREGSIVDATIVAAGTFTKSKTKQRDPEVKQTKEGNKWHFGMRAHIRIDAVTGMTPSVAATSANVADVTMAGHLVRSEDKGEARVTGQEVTLFRQSHLIKAWSVPTFVTNKSPIWIMISSSSACEDSRLQPAQVLVPLRS